MSHITVADAYAAFPLSGQLEGNKKSVGGYSSCKEIDVDPRKGAPFQGRHCQLTHIPIPVAPKERSNPVLPDFANTTLNILGGLVTDVSL